jgi:hypothetical protein
MPTTTQTMMTVATESKGSVDQIGMRAGKIVTTAEEIISDLVGVRELSIDSSWSGVGSG